MGCTQNVGPERLRRLYRHQRVPIRCVHDDLTGNHLDGVGHGDTGHGAVGTLPHGVDDPAVQCRRRQRPGGVVHAHHVGAIGYGRQPSAHGPAAGASPGDGALALGVVGGHHYDHPLAHFLGDATGSIDDPLATEQFVLLRTPVSIATTATDDDGPNAAPMLLSHAPQGSTVSPAMAQDPDHVPELPELLAGTDFFRDASTPALTALATVGRKYELVRNDTLFGEGDPPDCLYLVAQGRLAIAIANPIDRRESVVALMEPGDLFGELAMLDDGPRSAMARALEPTIVYSVPYRPVLDLLESEPRLLWNVTRLLAQRLRAMDEALADSVFLDVPGRTAKRLLELAGHNNEFVLPITQEELAGMVGASRERVNKALASFVRLGWLDQQDRRYVIVERDRLELRAR